MIVLSEAQFSQINALIEAYHGDLAALENSIGTQFSLPIITARSIVSQKFKRNMKYTYHRVKTRAQDIYYRYRIAVHNGEPEGVIIRLAQELGSSPALVGKLILQENKNAHTSPRKSQPMPMTREHEGSDDEEGTDKTKKEKTKKIGDMMRDTTLITDSRLAYEILLCTLQDTKYGSITELCNRLTGEEFEERLAREASKRGLSFQSEKDLRQRGYDKTPDLKLNVPIAVDGFIVNWIESKALFGTPEEHRRYIKDQYSSYWNRFGPGLVIYWFGFVESITDVQEKRFIVLNDFPREITYTRPLSIASKLSS